MRLRDPPGPADARADPGPGDGRAARAAAAHRRSPPGPHRRGRGSRPAGRTGPAPVEPAGHRRRRRPAAERPGCGPPRRLPAVGRDRRLPLHGPHRRRDRLAPDRLALRRAHQVRTHGRGRGQPGRRRGHGRRTGGRPGHPGHDQRPPAAETLAAAIPRPRRSAAAARPAAGSRGRLPAGARTRASARRTRLHPAPPAAAAPGGLTGPGWCRVPAGRLARRWGRRRPTSSWSSGRARCR